MTIERIIDELIDREGGYSDHPDDRGHKTIWGITEPVARAHGFAGPLKAMPRSFAMRIYRRDYWERPGYARVADLSEKIAEELFDTGVNMGPAVATTFLQRALNALNRKGRDYADIAVSKTVDAPTLRALTAFFAARGKAGETVLLKALEALQGERYLALAEKRPANESFLYGWLANRIGAF